MTRRSELQRELRQQRPFESPAHEAVVGLLRTADAVRRALGAVIEPSGITLQQFNVLRILRGAGDSGLPTLEIGVRMIEQMPGITRLIDRLEAKGLVRRERCASDRRQVLCWITAEGLELLAGLDQPIAEAQNALLRGVASGDLELVIAVMDGIRQTASQPRAR